MPNATPSLLQTADAADAAGVTPAAITRAARERRLRVYAVTPRGQRLFLAVDVEAYRRAREERAAGRKIGLAEEQPCEST